MRSDARLNQIICMEWRLESHEKIRSRGCLSLGRFVYFCECQTVIFCNVFIRALNERQANAC